ncbi:hypothetical protein Deba_2008 [Desulfarculus baarsii DSM 2075]|uniref:Uncharacterized protein n=1 Tax=Desulfarculus baarsii (strain ATCC 33931 / DSM 2075 / LMG 7858 / VKM B-1802 / 2st14) TaxID=644282 RepID=E1QLA8_DESB2|nr:hypothetical protein [Desulfarculus baarsii]ADK85373.1 hypothetical protein Deba_2008 [Desulfarculus baarsii DSM 2075]
MTTSSKKKHQCPDCRQCQGCSPARCNLCRGQGEDAASRFAGMSLSEQIALFEAVNRGDAPEGDYDAHGQCRCRR